MSAMGVDIELLIVEVKKRPPLYDTSNKQYHDRRLKKQLWDEVCSNLRSADIWNTMNIKHKMKYETEVLKKWNSLRTCFRRELRLNTFQTDGVTERKKRKYIYFDDLLFLLPFTKVFPVESLENDQASDLSDLSEEDTLEPTRSDTQEKLSEDNYEEPMIPIATIIKTEATEEADIYSELSELSDEEELASLSRNKSTHLNIKKKILTHKSDEHRQQAREVRLLGKRRICKLSEVDEDEAFLSSLLPSIKEFSTEEKLRLRIELLTTLLNFKKSNPGSSTRNN